MKLTNKEKMRIILNYMKEKYGREDRLNQFLNDPFKILITSVLSHRTRDKNAIKASNYLFKDVECPKDILRMDMEDLKNRIRCSGFYKQKAKNIIAICTVLEEDYNGLVPCDRRALINLQGVGPKTADIVLSHAFDVPAIAVDVHVETVAKRLGLVEPDNKPDKVKEILENLVLPDDYRYVDSVFVRHGKEYCRARNPKCGACIINNMCDYFQS